VSGRLAIVGLGPGAEDLQTPQARAALETATDLFGYTTYLDRVPVRAGQTRHGSDNREEIARARAALELAYAGKDVAIVSSGDPGVFAMAAAVFEAIDDGEPHWREIDVIVVPGISAMFATAARLGAPLGHDFCAISLSDNLKPWDTVIRRLDAAASADFVIALYNPISRARPWQLGAALDRLRAHRSPRTPVIFATAVSRGDEAIEITDLETADPARADMRTLVMIGSSATRLVPRPDRAPWVYTPRRVDGRATEPGPLAAECLK